MILGAAEDARDHTPLSRHAQALRRAKLLDVGSVGLGVGHEAADQLTLTQALYGGSRGQSTRREAGLPLKDEGQDEGISGLARCPDVIAFALGGDGETEPFVKPQRRGIV
jgi:hypothetical protein